MDLAGAEAVVAAGVEAGAGDLGGAGKEAKAETRAVDEIKLNTSTRHPHTRSTND